MKPNHHHLSLGMRSRAPAFVFTARSRNPLRSLNEWKPALTVTSVTPASTATTPCRLTTGVRHGPGACPSPCLSKITFRKITSVVTSDSLTTWPTTWSYYITTVPTVTKWCSNVTQKHWNSVWKVSKRTCVASLSNSYSAVFALQRYAPPSQELYSRK